MQYVPEESLGEHGVVRLVRTSHSPYNTHALGPVLLVVLGTPSAFTHIMSSIDRKSLEVSEKASREDGKHEVDEEIVSIVDSSDGDEALQLVGKERTAEFSDEYNRKLRRKLVRSYVFYFTMTSADHIYISGSSHTPALCCSVFHAVLVRIIFL